MNSRHERVGREAPIHNSATIRRKSSRSCSGARSDHETFGVFPPRRDRGSQACDGLAGHLAFAGRVMDLRHAQGEHAGIIIMLDGAGESQRSPLQESSTASWTRPQLRRVKARSPRLPTSPLLK